MTVITKKLNYKKIKAIKENKENKKSKKVNYNDIGKSVGKSADNSITSTDYPFLNKTMKIDENSINNIKNTAKYLKRQLYICDNENELPLEIKKDKKYKLGSLKRLELGRIHNEIVIIMSSWKQFEYINSITDYFTEECRVNCIFKGAQSLLSYWEKNKVQLRSELVKRKKSVTDYWLRELMYEKNKPCNNFRVSVCLEILRLFKPKRWLDISAGWGDRLLSALLYDGLEVYCGADPNPCLHPLYKKMIATFTNSTNNSKTRTNKSNHSKANIPQYILIKDGFETAVLPTGITYDLVFSSPPFFDLEIYSGDKSNSYVKYRGVDGWFNGFLMPSIYKSIEYLESGGHLVLYMGEAGGTKYIPEMISLIDKLTINCGIFYYSGGGGKLREFYCWQKK
uniref:Uncharacterized protein n=1 Tax=viral metagenome TaxID=1070528 RepID=A0A6C0HL48_9ZZZZ